MAPENVVRFCIAAVLLVGAAVGYYKLPKEARPGLVIPGILGVFFLISGLLPGK